MNAAAFPELTEFMNAYERDLSFLADARMALLDHPLRPSLPEVYNPSFCRLLVVTAIGAIEHHLDAWRHNDPHGVLGQYFAEHVRNGERVAALFNAFAAAGIELDRTVFDDYLAVKYLRNTIVHTRWKDEEKEWIQKRGFPLDTQQLNAEHWRRIRWVAGNMILYVYRVFWPIAKALFKAAPEAADDFPSVLSRHDFALVLWTNLERIDTRLYKAFNAASEAALIPGSWTTIEEWWTALWQASRTRPDLFESQRHLSDEALFSWDQYSQLTLEVAGLTIEKLSDAVVELRELYGARDPNQPRFLWTQQITGPEAYQLLRGQLRPGIVLDENRTIEALRLAANAYGAITNRTPCDLFAIRLPIVEPDKVGEFATRATRAILAMEAGQLWKGLVDVGNLPDLSWLQRLREIMTVWRTPP